MLSDHTNLTANGSHITRKILSIIENLTARRKQLCRHHVDGRRLTGAVST